MTIKDPQQSRCVELMAELGEASDEVKRKLSAEVNKTCGEATSQPFAQLLELRAKLTFCGIN